MILHLKMTGLAKAFSQAIGKRDDITTAELVALCKLLDQMGNGEDALTVYFDISDPSWPKARLEGWDGGG